MPKKSEQSREKSADKKKKKGDRDQSADREPSPSPSKDSAAIQQSKKGNSKKEDDEGKCYTVKSSPSHMAQCSNEQFLSSCLPLLATLSPKKNFLARINIQKALYDAIDEAPDEEGESEEDCCAREQPRRSQNNNCSLKSKKERRNS